VCLKLIYKLTTDWSLLGCDVALLGGNTVPYLHAYSYSSWTACPWRWRQYNTSKHSAILAHWHSITSHWSFQQHLRESLKSHTKYPFFTYHDVHYCPFVPCSTRAIQKLKILNRWEGTGNHHSEGGNTVVSSILPFPFVFAFTGTPGWP